MLFISIPLHPMDKLRLSYRKQLTHTSLACVMGVCIPLITPPLAAQDSAVQRELNRRAANAARAYELLKTGDTAYEKKDYAAAVKNYSQAFTLMPNGTKTEEIRVIAAVRYATAATEQARKLAKGGDYNNARNLLDTVLKPEIAPTHLGALKLRKQIDDPTRYNHALTPQHVRDVSKVGRDLREAEGFFSLGQYDRAVTVYQSVLRTDPYNKAARRGIEKINTVKSDYYRSARDHHRAELLSQLDKQWELTPPSVNQNTIPIPLTEPQDFAPDLRDRLTGINLDLVDLDNVSLSEALDFIRIQSRLADIPEANGEQTGINIVLNAGAKSSETYKRISSSRVALKVKNIPISKLLDYVTDQTSTRWRIDGSSILITPLNSNDGILSSRTFRVPANFLSSGATTQTNTDENIFDSDSSDRDSGILPAKISMVEFLKQNGVSFPDGAIASYSRPNNSLFIRNTPENIDLVDQLISLASNEEPVMVKIETTIIRVSEKKLKELGFDWAITPWGFNSNTFLGGGTTGNGSDLGLTSPFNPITSGNRSGSGITTESSIDTYLNASRTGTASTSTSRAPGILSLSYVGSGARVQMLMRGLNQTTGTDVMVNPSTIARSGQRSKIEVVREFIYPTEYEPPEMPNTFGGTTFIDLVTGETANSTPPTAITPAHPTAFATRNVGVTLEVEPTVGPDKNYIELSLRPELVEFEGFINYGSPINGTSGTTVEVDLAALGTGNAFTIIGGNFGEITPNRILMPVFKTIRTPNSSVTLQDGHSLVIGGLMTSRKTKVEDKIPLLGDIPYAGRLFRSEGEETFQEAIIISVTAELVDPSGKPWRSR